MKATQRTLGLLILASLLPAMAGCDRSAGPAQAAAATAQAPSDPAQTLPRRGGAATVLLSADFAGAWPAGLDPATNVTGGSNISLMNSIYGGLVQLTADADGSHPRIVGVLAAGYEIQEGGRAIVFHLRDGVTFSDGTPFDAEAVRFNIERSLTSECSCSPSGWPWAREGRVTAPDARTVVLRFSRPFGPAINAFPATNLNWIASPAALRRLGETQFKITPVGAGPFQVVSDQLSSKLVLERNLRYWQKDRPYLDRLTFESIGSEQAAYQAILAGDASAYEGMANTLLVRQAKSDPRVSVTIEPPTSPLVIQLNTSVPPFDKPRAREAIYYATNVEAIRQGLFKGWYPATQSFTAPGGLFFQPAVPGYRTYDLEQARRAVKELGGLRVTLGTLRTPVAEQVITALQSQWQEAGIEVTLAPDNLATLISTFQGGRWEAMLQTAGSYDPDSGSGLDFRFGSKGIFSGVHDPALDRLAEAATETVDATERGRLYEQVARYISDKAYAPFLIAQSPAQLTHGIYAPGLTTHIPAILINTGVLWQDAWVQSN